jgi:hypothetical protein
MGSEVKLTAETERRRVFSNGIISLDHIFVTTLRYDSPYTNDIIPSVLLLRGA